MGVLVVLAVGLLGFYTWHSEDSIRIAGYALQLIGMMLAIHGLLEVRKHLKQPLFRQLFLNWIKRFPKWTRSVFISGGIISGATGVTGRAETWMPDDSERPIEQRIERIIKNLENVRNEQRELARSITNLEQRHEAHVKQVALEYDKMAAEYHTKLEAIHVSGQIESLVGLILLTIGITMSSLAPELYKSLY